MNPIPNHLAQFHWYAEHMAWLKQEHGYSRHDAPEGTTPKRANLDGASLDGANLVGASLDGASLDGASLDGANLVGANLVGIKADFFKRLAIVPNEVAGLRLALVEGRVNGNCYEGTCACFVGTIANVRKCNFRRIDGLEPDSNSPTERWFLAIRPGDTPEKSQAASITVKWIDEWLAAVTIQEKAAAAQGEG